MLPGLGAHTPTDADGRNVEPAWEVIVAKNLSERRRTMMDLVRRLSVELKDVWTSACGRACRSGVLAVPSQRPSTTMTSCS